MVAVETAVGDAGALVFDSQEEWYGGRGLRLPGAWLQERGSQLHEIVSLADQVLGSIDTLELLAALGARTDKKDQNNKQ